MVDARLLEIKKKMNRKRPKFIRQDYYHRMKVEDDAWRRPRGRHSKMRERRIGKRKRVDVGYRSPAGVRGLHFSGVKLINISNLVQLAKVNPKEEVAIISSNLGRRKRYQLVKFAAEKNIQLFNIKDPNKFLSTVDAELKARKEAKIQKAAEKKSAEETSGKSATKPAEAKPTEQKKQEEVKKEPKPVAEKKPKAPKEVAKK